MVLDGIKYAGKLCPLAGCKVHPSPVKQRVFAAFPAEESQIILIRTERGKEKAILRLINDSELVKRG